MHGNLILIGMPASGKSTLGRLVAQRLSLDFVDTDDLLQAQAGKPLQAILDGEGRAAFFAREEAAVLSLQARRAVIATGGSVVYSRPAMEHLKAGGLCVYIQVSLAGIQARLDNLDTRGVTLARGQTLAALYAERRPLYEGWADRVFPVDAHPAVTPQAQAILLAEQILRWQADLSR